MCLTWERGSLWANLRKNPRYSFVDIILDVCAFLPKGFEILIISSENIQIYVTSSQNVSQLSKMLKILTFLTIRFDTTESWIQGDPNQNLKCFLAITLKLCISDPMLVKPKCIWEAYNFFDFQLFVYNFSKKLYASQTHFGFTNMESEMLSFRDRAN